MIRTADGCVRTSPQGAVTARALFSRSLNSSNSPTPASPQEQREQRNSGQPLQQMKHDDENKKGSEHIYCKVEPKLIEIFIKSQMKGKLEQVEVQKQSQVKHGWDREGLGQETGY